MSRTQTLTSYVKENLDNLYWGAIENHISTIDYDSLRLKLNQIEVIEKVEISSIDVKNVYAFDAPDDKIKFKILVESELEVYDKNYRKNELTEFSRQWFIIECVGSLDSKLSDSTVLSVEEYNYKPNDNNAFSNSLVPIMTKADCETFANDFIQRYCPEVISEQSWVDPYSIANTLGLTVIEHPITEDNSVFGQIYFEDSEAKVYDISTLTYKNIVVEEGTIIVEPRVAFFRNLGAKYNTIIHECVHWMLHRKAFKLEKLFNNNENKFSCLIKGGIRESNSEEIKWIEWQANTIAPMIQMPSIIFKNKVEEAILKYKKTYRLLDSLAWIEPVIDEVAQFFMVSRLAAKIRMIDLGYEEARWAFVYVDGKYIPPHKATNKVKINNNLTFSIPWIDLAIEIKKNSDLFEDFRKGKYTYVESHVVLNSPKYVKKNANGFEELTYYARQHMEECCLLFSISVKNHLEFSKYDSLCILNRDQNSPIEFTFAFNNGYQNSAKDVQDKALQDWISDTYAMFNSLTNDYTRSLKIIMKSKNINQKQLAEKIGISEDTVSRCLTGKTSSLNTMLLICLGLNLPPIISHKILADSGHKLVPTKEEHQYYEFVLQAMHGKDISEIREFLNSHHIATL